MTSALALDDLPLTIPALPPSIGDAHVWLARDTALADRVEVLLDPGEQARASRYARKADRARFLVGCALLRLAASRYLGVPLGAIALDRGCPHCGQPHGKPRYVAPAAACALEASVSHSGRFVVAAFARSPIGIDVEELGSSTGLPGLVRLALSRKEQKDYAAVAADPLRRFLVYWTRKEALTKALGLGLRLPFNQVTVTAPEARPELCSWPLDHPPESIVLRDLRLEENTIAALAIAGPLKRLTVVNVAWEDARLVRDVGI